jgi:hypothetical protein
MLQLLHWRQRRRWWLYWWLGRMLLLVRRLFYGLILRFASTTK